MLTLRSRAIAVAAAAALALTTFSATPADAGSRRGDAAALAMMAGLFGTIAVIAAANSARDRHHSYYGPHYATPGPAYGSPMHGGSRWGGWHRHHWQR